MSRIDELITELCPNGVEFKALGEIGTITRGKRFVKADIIETGTPCIHYGELYTKYGTSASTAFSFLKPEFASRLRFARPGDVIIVSAGETIEDIGKSVAWLGSEEVVIHDALYAFRSWLDPKYVTYFTQTDDFHDQIRRFISSSKISAISTENLGKVRIPVLPIEVQREIVKVLDTFASLEAELEAELEARRRQYTYYRDRLLRFKELE
jgi:type I restriction enzyme, S subunit